MAHHPQACCHSPPPRPQPAHGLQKDRLAWLTEHFNLGLQPGVTGSLAHSPDFHKRGGRGACLGGQPVPNVRREGKGAVGQEWNSMLELHDICLCGLRDDVGQPSSRQALVPKGLGPGVPHCVPMELMGAG